MFCKKCGNEIKEGEKFCTQCGSPTTKEEPNKAVEHPISNTTLDQVANHLEFLGYEITKNEPEKEGETPSILAKHQKHYNQLISGINPHLTYFRIFVTTEKKLSPEMGAFINSANKVFDAGRVYYDIQDDKVVLILEAVYWGSYIKEVFGQFMSMFEADQGKIAATDGFAKLFLN